MILPAARGAEPSREQILALNAEALFGGDVTVKEDRVTVRYFPGKGRFTRGFAVRNVRGAGFYGDESDVKDVALRRVLLEGAKGEFSCLGRESGTAVSKFELADDWRISFRLRIASLPPNALFNLTVNQADSRNNLQISFFREILAVDGSKRRRTLTSNRAYAAHPATWFDRRSPGVPFEVTFKENTLSVAMTIEASKEKKQEKDERVELVSMEGIENATRGKLTFEFRNLSFLVSDLVVEGKYDPAWAEGEIARLKRAGDLKVEEPEKPAEANRDAPPPSAKDLGIPSIPPARKVGAPDLKRPDPDAGDEL